MNQESNDVRSESIDGVLVIHLRASFYTSNRMAQNLKQLLLEFFNSNKFKIVINMSQVQSIDSEGLGVLTNAYKQCISRGGNFVLCEIPNKDVYDVLEIVNIDKIIPIYHSQKEALTALVEGN